MSEKEESINMNEESIETTEDKISSEGPLTKPKRKHTVPQSQKQKDNFAKAREKRAENIRLAKIKKEEEMVKKYINNKKVQEVQEVEEEKIVYVKKKKPPKYKYVYDSYESKTTTTT